MPSILIDTSTDGTTIVAAPDAFNHIRVLGLNLTADDAVTVSLKSNSTTIWKTYATNNPTTPGGIVIPTDPNNTIDCAPGEALKLGLSGAVAVAGTLEYVILGRPPIGLTTGALV